MFIEVLVPLTPEDRGYIQEEIVRVLHKLSECYKDLGETHTVRGSVTIVAYLIHNTIIPAGHAEILVAWNEMKQSIGWQDDFDVTDRLIRADEGGV